MLVNNDDLYKKLELCREKFNYDNIPDQIKQKYQNEMLLRLSWNTNHLEGNTLTLDETIDVIEYDEVRSGHTYDEYTEAKNAYRAYKEQLDFDNFVCIDEKYIQDGNALIIGSDGGYRENRVYIGTLAETAYVPPIPEHISRLMEKYVQSLVQLQQNHDISVKDLIYGVSKAHMDFERIHPFQDGNGRTGRLFMNQILLDKGLQPTIIENNSKYRQAFRHYDKNKDTSLMEHCIASGIIRSYEVMKQNAEIVYKDEAKIDLTDFSSSVDTVTKMSEENKTMNNKTELKTTKDYNK